MSTSTSPSFPMSSSSDSSLLEVTQQQQQHETACSYEEQQEEPMEPQQHVQQTGSQSEDDEQPLQELESATSFVPAMAAAAPASPDKPSYGELQLRCQMLEAALEQQRQSSQAALTATLAGTTPAHGACAATSGLCTAPTHLPSVSLWFGFLLLQPMRKKSRRCVLTMKHKWLSCWNGWQMCTWLAQTQQHRTQRRLPRPHQQQRVRRMLPAWMHSQPQQQPGQQQPGAPPHQRPC